MSRNASGNYSLPDPETPFIPNTVINSTDVNTVLSDIETEITNSLDRGGRGAMTAPLVVPSGSAAAPSLTFNGDTNTGIYASAADTLGFSAGGTVRATLASGQLLTIDGALATPALSFISDPNTGIYRAGADDLRIATNGADRLAITTNLTVTAATAATGAARQNAAVLANGDLSMSGVVNPDKDVALSNVLTPKSFVKAWAFFSVTFGNGSPFTTSFTEGLNITSIARQSATLFRVTFASAFASANYIPIIQVEGVSTIKPVVSAGRTTTTADFAIQTVATGNAIDMDATAAVTYTLVLAVLGPQ